jgi:ribonuclease D
MITTKDALVRAVEEMAGCEFIAVDTEFIREKTYYPQLCLIQIAYNDTVALIDPLQKLDLMPLRDVMCSEKVLKVFHSGQQDLEIFYQLFGEPVKSLFDTQVAAALIGMTDQVSYAIFIRTMLGHELDKGGTFSQWSKRPLTPSQIEYAKDDVKYLLKAYPLLRDQLEKADRLSWLDDEFAYRATRAYVEDVDPQEAFRFVKRVSALNPRQAAVAREVTAWRQTQAIRIDRPRRQVLGDECIIEIARKQPLTRRDLDNVRGLSNYAQSNAYQIIEAVRVGKDTPQKDLPVLKRPEKRNIEIESTAQLARALVYRRAKDAQIAPNILASQSMIEEFVRTPDDSAQLMQGWRKMMIGNDLVDLIEGNIALSIDKGKLQITSSKGRE